MSDRLGGTQIHALRVMCRLCIDLRKGRCEFRKEVLEATGKGHALSVTSTDRQDMADPHNDHAACEGDLFLEHGHEGAIRPLNARTVCGKNDQKVGFHLNLSSRRHSSGLAVFAEVHLKFPAAKRR